MELTIQEINSKIYEIRDMKVMLDSDLAKLYQVETKVLNQAVKRNIDRFPEDFMFQLTENEEKSLRSQFVTLENNEEKSLRGKHRKYNSFVFTEHGILMLSSVLRSKIAIEVNIKIMRTFTALRKYALTHDELAQKIEELENRIDKGEQVDRQILDVLSQLISDDKAKETKKIGFV